jgi:3-oxo-5alpha-steroid 4-dehydrogenase
VQDVVLSENGSECVGVKLQCLPELEEWGDVQAMHVMLHEIGSGSPMFDPKRKMDTQCRKVETQLMEKFAVPVEIRAKGGVVLATGGFFFNQNMVQQHAPKHDGFMPLGNLGDDGSGISVAARAGAALDRMDRCSAWKFINPPYSFVRGVLLNAQGERVGNEDVYGASFADFLIQHHGGKGWLVIDQCMWDEANRDCLDPESGLQEDQRMQGLANLHRNFKKGKTWGELASNAGMDPEALERTMEAYNKGAIKKTDSQFGKSPMYIAPLHQGPFYAINLDMVGNKFWPTPCMSLGGVKVEGASGQAISQSTGQPIAGLYAAGRTAVGVASNYYVSGLSLADCIFSGRRAGKHAAGRC